MGKSKLELRVISTDALQSLVSQRLDREHLEEYRDALEENINKILYGIFWSTKLPPVDEGFLPKVYTPFNMGPKGFIVRVTYGEFGKLTYNRFTGEQEEVSQEKPFCAYSDVIPNFSMSHQELKTNCTLCDITGRRLKVTEPLSEMCMERSKEGRALVCYTADWSGVSGAIRVPRFYTGTMQLSNGDVIPINKADPRESRGDYLLYKWNCLSNGQGPSGVVTGDRYNKLYTKSQGMYINPVSSGFPLASDYKLPMLDFFWN